MIKQYFKSAKVSAITDLIGCINEMKCTELIVIYRSYSILGCLLMRSLFIELVKGNRFWEVKGKVTIIVGRINFLGMAIAFYL
jgi:hypothetical protein